MISYQNITTANSILLLNISKLKLIPKSCRFFSFIQHLCSFYRSYLPTIYWNVHWHKLCCFIRWKVLYSFEAEYMQNLLQEDNSLAVTFTSTFRNIYNTACRPIIAFIDMAVWFISKHSKSKSPYLHYKFFHICSIFRCFTRHRHQLPIKDFMTNVTNSASASSIFHIHVPILHFHMCTVSIAFNKFKIFKNAYGYIPFLNKSKLLT